jgi:hypothetical protein
MERHLDRAPALSIYSQTLGNSAARFITAFEHAEGLQSAVTTSIDVRSQAVDLLGRTMRAWSAALAKDLKGFDRSKYGDKPNVPEDVINDAESMLIMLDKHVEAGGELPFYADTLKQDMTAQIEAAKAELAQTGTQSATLSDARAELKAAAVEFHRDLVAFRSALRALVGPQHADYQKLRVARGSTPDVDDDVKEDLPEGEHVDVVDEESESNLEVLEEAS